MTHVSLTADTLQGIMADNPDPLSLIVTFHDGREFEIGLMYRGKHDRKTLEVGNNEDLTFYSVRKVFLWRPLGSKSLSVPFPVVAYSSMRAHFLVLDEKWSRKSKRGPIEVASVRIANDEDQLGTSLSFSDDDLEQLLRA